MLVAYSYVCACMSISCGYAIHMCESFVDIERGLLGRIFSERSLGKTDVFKTCFILSLIISLGRLASTCLLLCGHLLFA